MKNFYLISELNQMSQGDIRRYQEQMLVPQLQ